MASLRDFATARECEFLDAIEKHGSERKAAEALGVNRGTVSSAIRRVRYKAAKRGFSPEHDMQHVVPEGYKVRGTSTLYDEFGKPRLQWVKSDLDAQKQAEMMQAAFNAMAEELPRVKPVPFDGKTDSALCNLVVFTDYHLGMLAWHKEGGADWDLKIAEQMLLAAFLHLVESSPKAEKCVLALQGDFLHTDGLLPVTPAHHHVLDTDGRFSKIVASAIRVIRRLIDHALQKHSEVHLIVAEGNHDESSSVWLRQMFAALYEQEPRLTVNASELPFYVVQHGDVMLAFHHGHKVKNEQLPGLFAAQFAWMWGQTTKRYCHTGHRHHVDEKEYAGMTVIQQASRTCATRLPNPENPFSRLRTSCCRLHRSVLAQAVAWLPRGSALRSAAFLPMAAIDPLVAGTAAIALPMLRAGVVPRFSPTSICRCGVLPRSWVAAEASHRRYLRGSRCPIPNGFQRAVAPVLP